ncbi:lumenal Hsp70 protein [Scheffersomyces spartinae]|uniref:Lumenal Hsp70 protein n=1 Tax=Scheffersomyces spartinae TaxID=45513 RepID=A0A9P8AKW3_9ASCO|nr:lumenal Hsp70 protein [Scheffersomyces spartinae]KAG7195499.1 lumenal Hsp70 protein [Scheffersomyces spartinae]
MRWFKLFLVLSIVAIVEAAIMGIDYGQQYSKAVLLAPNINFDIVLNNEGKRKDLSGMCIRASSDGDGGLERVYGSSILSLLTRFPQSCVSDLKSLMGKEFDSQDVQQYIRNHFVQLRSDSNRRDSVLVDFIGSKKNSSYHFTPEEVMAMELNQIKDRANQMLNSLAKHSKLDDIIISIAPFASQETRQSYLDTLSLVGIKNVIGIVEDGTAVALNYVSNRKLADVDYDDIKRYSIVYDMGAGSTTATLFSITPFKGNKTIQVEIEALGFETSISGKALTDMVYDVLLGKFMDHFKVDLGDITPRISNRLRDSAEKTKTILSANSDYRVSLESIYNDHDFHCSISRDEIEEIANDLMPLITKPILSALKDADNLPILSLEAVILNGGSTRVPFVQKHLSVLLGGDGKIAKTVNTDESCALGVTFAGYLSKNPSASVKLVDKVFHNYQIKVDNTEDETLVFPKGSIVESKKDLNLGILKSDAVIDLYEDDCFIKSYVFEDLVKKSSKLSCGSKDEKVIIGTFSIDQNKIFDLEELNVKCTKTEKEEKTNNFFKNLMKKKDENEDVEEVEEEEDNDDIVAEEIDHNDSETEQPEFNGTSTNSSSSLKKPTIKRAKMRTIFIAKPRPKQARINPFSRSEKKEIESKLFQLDLKDKERAQVESIKNEVEASCYALRSKLDDLEDVLLEIMDEEELEGHREYVSELLEWLDFESSGTTFKAVNKHLKEVTHRLGFITDAERVKEVDLSLEGIHTTLSKALEMVNLSKEKTTDYEKNVTDFKTLYTEGGFDFETVENSFNHKHSCGEFFSKLNSYLKAQMKKLQALQAKLENTAEELSKKKLFELHNEFTEIADGLEKTLTTATDLHNKRVKYFFQRYDKFVERKKIKELRKLKEELLKSASEAPEKSSSDSEKSSSTSDAGHDEL